MESKKNLEILNMILKEIASAPEEEVKKWDSIFEKYSSNLDVLNEFELIPPIEPETSIINDDFTITTYIDKLLEANKPSWKFAGINDPLGNITKHMKTVTYAA